MNGTSFIRRRIWRARTLGFATLALMITLAIGNQPLITGEAPRGNVSLQWAAQSARAESIVRSWSDRKLLGAAARQLQLDFLFIVLYVPLLILLAQRASRDVGGRWSALAPIVIGLAIIAGLLDAIENVGSLELISQYRGPPPRSLSAATTLLVTACSYGKFALLIVCLILLLILDIRRVSCRAGSGSTAQSTLTTRRN